MSSDLLSEILDQIKKLEQKVSQQTEDLDRDKQVLAVAMALASDILIDRAAELKYRSENILTAGQTGDPRIYECHVCEHRYAHPLAVQVHLENCHKISTPKAMCGAILSCPPNPPPHFPETLKSEMLMITNDFTKGYKKSKLQTTSLHR